MKKVYAVASGQYSDYGVHDVFSTKKKAQNWINVRESIDSYHQEYFIEEFELDPPAKAIDMYGIDMLKDGTVHHSYLRRVMVGSEENLGYVGYTDPTSNYCKNKDVCALNWNVETDDLETAVKIVGEKRAEILAAGIWGDDDKIRAYFAAQVK